MISRARGGIAVVAMLFLLHGCGPSSSGPVVDPPPVPRSAVLWSESDPEQVRTADYSILFVGNSHTIVHDVPGLITSMIRFHDPSKTTYSLVLPVGFLEEVARNPRYQAELDERKWKYIVLQAQKISVSGKHEYSRAEGIEYAKKGKSLGARVVFYPEWGLKGVPGDGPRQEKVYLEMAEAAQAEVAPVGRAWDLALSRRPDLPLHAGDGNHQTAVGAFLTACVLYGQLTGINPAVLATFPDDRVNEADRKFLAEVAGEIFEAKAVPKQHP